MRLGGIEHQLAIFALHFLGPEAQLQIGPGPGQRLGRTQADRRLWEAVELKLQEAIEFGRKMDREFRLPILQQRRGQFFELTLLDPPSFGPSPPLGPREIAGRRFCPSPANEKHVVRVGDRR